MNDSTSSNIRVYAQQLYRGSASIASLVDSWRRFSDQRKTVIFAPSVEDSLSLVQRFSEAGVTAEHLAMETGRAETLERLESGATQVVSIVDDNYGDLPSLACVILARPKVSLAHYLEQVALVRHHPGVSHGVVLDVAGCVIQHGFPYDAHPEQTDTPPVPAEPDGTLWRSIICATFDLLQDQTKKELEHSDIKERRESLYQFSQQALKLVALVAASTTTDDIQPNILRTMIEEAEARDQCRMCDQYLDQPENDNGDGELLGHELDCPIATARELLVKFDALHPTAPDTSSAEWIRKNAFGIHDRWKEAGCPGTWPDFFADALLARDRPTVDWGVFTES